MDINNRIGPSSDPCGTPGLAIHYENSKPLYIVFFHMLDAKIPEILIDLGKRNL